MTTTRHKNVSSARGKKRVRFGLKARLLTPLFCIITLTLCLATFLVVDSAEKALLETAKEKLTNAAATTGTNITLQLKRTRADLIAASLVPSLREVLDPNDAPGRPAREALIRRTNKVLETLSAASSSYERLYIASETGTALACSVPEVVGFLDVSDRIWFPEVATSNDVIVSAPYRSRYSGETILAVVKKITHNGYDGIMAGSLQLDKMLMPALRINARDKFHAAVITDKGEIVASLGGSRADLDISAQPWFKTILASQEGYISIFDMGEDKMLAFYRLPNAPLYAIAVAKTKDLLGPARFTRNLGIMILLFVFIGAYVTIYLSLAPIIRYTRKLARISKKIGKGDLSQKIPIMRHDELGDLAFALSSMLDNLKQMIFRAEEATKAKSDFLARMSHEIRTPLNAITGMAYLSLQNSDCEGHRAAFTKILTAAESLLGIVNDILDFSKVEAGKLELESVPFSLRETVESCTELLRGRADAKEISLNLHVDEAIPDILIGDSLRISQVCINLCSNAIKFTEQGSVTLGVELGKNMDGAVELYFHVKDTGIGIAEQERQDIFDAFAQADDSITRRFGGTGLGLAICKHLVDLMHGKIWVESTPGQGSVFHFSLYLPVHSEQKLPLPQQRIPSIPIPLAEKAKVLVVEDNTLNQEIATGLLRLIGITPTIVDDGAKAVAICEEQRFDLVFMDIQMPVMDGLEAVRRIRASDNPAVRDTPIVAMTANALLSDKAKSMEAGMNAHLTKPISHVELAETVRYWYGKTTGDNAH